MKTKLALALTVVGLTMGLASTGMAATNADEGDVTVNVSSKMKIDVSPDTLNYGAGSGNAAIEPGSYENTSDTGYKGIEVENVGSLNVTNIYTATSEPRSRPFGTGNPGAYDAGNFIQLKVSGEASSTQTSQGYSYAGRREYNESNPLSYVQTNDDADQEVYGRFRTGNESFFWAINDSAANGVTNDNACAGAGGEQSWLMLGEDAHTKNNIGSVDFRSETGTSPQYTAYNITQGTPDDTGVVDTVTVKTREGDKNYEVRTFCGINGEDTWVEFRKFDRESNLGSNQLYAAGTTLVNMLDASSGVESQSALQPGEHFTVNTRVSVPFAVAEGSVSTGNLTIIANDN